MTDIVVEIMVEVLTILAIATQEVKRGRFSELKSSVYSRFLTERLFRKVSLQIDGKQRHRELLGEVGQIDTRRSMDGICGAAEDDTLRQCKCNGGRR